MADSPFDRKDRLTGPLVGATMVLVLGAVGCSIVMAAMGGDPVAALVLFFGTIALIVVMLWVFKATPEVGASMYGWVKSRHARPAPLAYEPTLRETGKKRFGTNAPPTANDVREMKDDLRTWIPNPGHPSGRPPRKRG